MKQVVRKEPSSRSAGKPPHVDSEVSELMLAVLEDAMRTFKDGVDSPIPAKRVEAFKVEAWVMSDDTDWPFAFVTLATQSASARTTCALRCESGAARPCANRHGSTEARGNE